jgi:hypothetical protein
MRKRAMRLMAAIFGSAVAGLPLTAIPETAVQADDCLAAPDGEPAQGGHWRYRIDRATSRQCWYVRSDDQEAGPLASASARPVAPPTRAPLQRSVANARAEISPVSEAVQPNNSNGSFTANIVNGDITASIPPMLRAQTRTLTGRLPDYSNAIVLAEATPSIAVAGSRHRPQPASARQVGHPATGSIRTLLSALAGALALVGAASAVVTKFGRKAIGRRKKRGRERTIWKAPPSDDMASPVSSPVRSSDEASMDWIRIARESQETNRQAEQIEQLLSRAARRSAV